MKTFKPYNPDQLYLLPPALRDWLPEGHLALFISDVVDMLDLEPIFSVYEQGDGRGQPPYHPAMMVKLMIYGYCTGKPSSRKIERASYEGVAYRVRDLVVGFPKGALASPLVKGGVETPPAKWLRSLAERVEA